MTRFQHTVTVAAVPRRWFESSVLMLHDLADSVEAEGTRLRLPDGRRLPEVLLVEGGHLHPDARYHPQNGDSSGPDLDATVTILAWNRKRRTAVELVVLDDDPDGPGHMACTLWLASGERPREASLSVKLRAGDGTWTRYAAGGGRLHLDLGKWWSSTADRGRLAATPLTGRLDHTFARSSLTVVPRPVDDGRWRVTVTVRVKGALIRPSAGASRHGRRRLAGTRDLRQGAGRCDQGVEQPGSGADPEGHGATAAESH